MYTEQIAGGNRVGNCQVDASLGEAVHRHTTGKEVDDAVDGLKMRRLARSSSVSHGTACQVCYLPSAYGDL